MPTGSGKKRTDTASRVIAASPQALYRAFVDPAAIASWRPPQGMKAEIHTFDPREGGGYRMSFLYTEPDPEVQGKTSDHTDTFEGRFVGLIPGERIVEEIDFVSDDPAFRGTMTITTTFRPVSGGTEVTVVCEDVPEGIGESDHKAGIASSLANLAAFVE
ncbi:MAG TPA: SRPBCC family protein [Hyphomicrobium zavarzinii]|nr:SRPBCC family protein [Hyphomicrobium zavarzinii]